MAIRTWTKLEISDPFSLGSLHVELAELIYEYGTGDWDTKAEHFSTTRTGMSMRGRYQRLQAEAQKEGIDDMVDVRVAMWNTQTRRRLSGNAAPRRCRVRQYLRDHPGYEILDGQDECTRRSQKELAADFWTVQEDAELAELVDQYGTGDWESKAQSFSSAAPST